MKIPKKNRLVLIRWEDIQTCDGWMSPFHDVGLASCMTVGIVVGASRHKITIAACVGVGKTQEDTEVNMMMCIPVGCITSWCYMTEGESVK